MLVLGIDPGSTTTGYGLVRDEGARLAAVAFGTIATRSALPFPHRLRQIFEALRGLMVGHRPDVAAVEGVFFARNVQSAIKLGQARGAALLAAAVEGVPVFEYAPRQVKGAVSGYGGAEKGQVQAMVKVLLGLAEPPEPADAADALALAICHHHAVGARGRLVRV
ncbi:MAG TPA: crossover junction endodeoxyribonuclease RuvC [Candidatus Methylomirabilis sp.]|jgi:crossover junction endodeoxyribonuclease RuvC